MRLSHIHSSVRTVAREQGLGRLTRLAYQRVRELIGVRVALHGDTAAIAAHLMKLVNGRLEFDGFTIKAAHVEACDKKLLRAFCFRRYADVAKTYPPLADTLDALSLLLLCDILYRTWDYRAIVKIAPTIRRTITDPAFAKRADNMLRRAQISSGQLSAAERDLMPLADGSLADFLLRADVWNASGRMELATVAYRRAIEIQSDNPMARLHYGFHLLKKGAIAEGLVCWGLAERIFGYFPLRHVQPLWRGEPLGDKSLMIAFEHGFGDMIQFVRYLVPLRQRHPEARIIGLVPAPIISLFEQSFPDATFVANDREIVADYHVAATQLPIVLGASMYEPRRYLKAGQPKPKTAERRKQKIGVCWRGHPRQYEQSRSISIEMFSRVFSSEADFIVLLNQTTPAEAAHLKTFANVTIPSIRDFAGLGDAINDCDLVVTVDTSIVHLAGALGKRTILLSRPDACWRWGALGETSPWYDDITVVRHPLDLDWPHVLAQTRDLIDTNRMNELPVRVHAIA